MTLASLTPPHPCFTTRRHQPSLRHPLRARRHRLLHLLTAHRQHVPCVVSKIIGLLLLKDKMCVFLKEKRLSMNNACILDVFEEDFQTVGM